MGILHLLFLTNRRAWGIFEAIAIPCPGIKSMGVSIMSPLPQEVWHMRNLTQFAMDFVTREDGPTAVEYAVMLALIIVVCLVAISTLGSNANGTYTTVGNAIGTAS
jgi:pilus assembly protein Flp/PilA